MDEVKYPETSRLIAKSDGQISTGVHPSKFAGPCADEKRSIFEQALFSIEDAASVLRDRLGPVMHPSAPRDEAEKPPQQPNTSIVVERLNNVAGILLSILHGLDI